MILITGYILTGSLETGNNLSDTVKLNSNGILYGNNIYVVWIRNPDDKIVGNLFYLKSSGNGATFSAAQYFTEKNILNVEVTAGNDIVYVAWQGILPNVKEEILINRSLDSGFNPKTLRMSMWKTTLLEIFLLSLHNHSFI